jgi:glycine oxidase
MTNRVFDAVVVGAGVVGMSVAWRAAQASMSVAVCDPAPGRGASWAAAGMLAPTTEARLGEALLHELARCSAAGWPAFAAELQADSGIDVGLRREGTISVAFDADDLRGLLEDVKVQRDLGCASQPLSARECRELEPALSPRVVGGAFQPDDHQVDNRAVLVSLAKAARHRGAEILRVAVRQLLRGRDGRVNGVELDDGPALGARTVVLAAGCRSAQVRGLTVADVPPVRPVKGQILRLRQGVGRSVPLLGHTVRAVAQGRHVYLVPRANGELVVGATVEEKGFDTIVTAGAVFDLLRTAAAVVPDVGELELAEAMARLRPGTPDNGPVLGPAPSEGLLIATGHFRHGFLLAPATATALTAALAGRPLSGPAAAFGTARFWPQSTTSRQVLAIDEAVNA